MSSQAKSIYSPYHIDMLPDKNNDKNIVRNAMIVLFLSLLIVYVVWYQVHENQTTSQVNTDQWSIADSLTITEQQADTGVYLTNPTAVETWTDTIETGEQLTQTQESTWSVQEEPILSITPAETWSSTDEMDILSWTTLYFGPIEWIDKLWITYNYALKDDKNIYYAALGDKEPDLSAIARSLWGTLYTMNTETEIIKNQLFGKRIVFINLPEYKDKITLMYIEVGSKKWLLQISYSIYHQSKSYLQDLFTN